MASDAKKRRKAANVAAGTRDVAFADGMEEVGYAMATDGAVYSPGMEFARSNAIDARFALDRERFADNSLIQDALDEARRDIWRSDALSVKAAKKAQEVSENRREEIRAELIEKGMSDSEANARASVLGASAVFIFDSQVRSVRRGVERAAKDGKARFFLVADDRVGGNGMWMARPFPVSVEIDGETLPVCKRCLGIGEEGCVCDAKRGEAT